MPHDTCSNYRLADDIFALITLLGLRDARKNDSKIGEIPTTPGGTREKMVPRGELTHPAPGGDLFLSPKIDLPRG